MKVLIQRMILVFAMGLLFAGNGNAQQQWNLTFSPRSVAPGECFTITVANAAWITIDIQWTDPVWGPLTMSPWVSLDGNGQDDICTDVAQNLGTYTVTAIRNTIDAEWVPISSSVNVVAQPAGLSIDPAWGYAGVASGIGSSCKTMTFAGGASLTVDMLFTVDSDPGTFREWGAIVLDSMGQWIHCDDHFTHPGSFTVAAIRNVGAVGWVWLPLPVTWTLLPPQPASLSFSTPMVHPGGSYGWYVGNGGEITIDVMVTLNNEPSWTGYGSFTLDSSGAAVANLPETQPLGRYHVTAIKNTANSDWVHVDASIDVCASSMPTVTSVSPAGTSAGESRLVTVYGTNLCNINSVVSEPSGYIRLDDIAYSRDGSWVTANLSVASNAPNGIATVTFVTGNGDAQFSFDIEPAPIISGISLSRSGQGTNVPVTLVGNNLNGASLSTSWSGLSFSETSSTDTSVTATYNISPDAAVGTTLISVTTRTGSTATRLFSIAGPALSREYIYLGDRILAVDVP